MHPRGIAARAIAARLAAAWAAGLVLATILGFAVAPTAYAGRCNTTVHQPSLDGLTATPMSGGPTTVIQFSVVYRDTRGCEPSSVRILVPGATTLDMTPTGGTFKDGMTFVASTTLPAGSWPFGADATSGFGPGLKTVAISGSGTIVITAPTPTPTPTPKPTATPTPTPRPTTTPKPTAKPTPKPTARPTAKPGSTGPKTTPKPTRSPAPSPAPGSETPGGPSDAGSAAGGPLGGAGGDDGSGGTAGSGGSPLVPILVAAVVLVLGGALLAGARRRRRPPDEPEAPAPVPAPEPEPDPGPIELGPLAPIDDALRGNLPTRPALRFAKPATGGAVRGTIAYRHVRVSAGPDDLRFPELARLEQRDEVEVIGETAGFLQVRMPTGQVGWVPRMVFVGAGAPRPAGA